MPLRRAAVCLVLVSACGDSGPPEQPGAEDATARPWELAGSWYPEDPDELDDAVDEVLSAVRAGAPRPALAILTPHASLPVSGPTAARVFARVVIPDRIILLAPDHWGDGAPTAIWTGGPWLVPGHAIAIDQELVAELRDALPDLEDDRVPFENHEEEMQLPFLQFLRPEASIAAIAMYDNSRRHFDGFDVERITAWGDALAGILTAHAGAGENVLLLTTTDLTHHETIEVGDEQDPELLDRIGALDIDGLHDYVASNQISMCGEIPTAIMMATLRALGRDSIDVIGRGSSYEQLGDPDDVVGYPAAAAWE
ncbi:MAG TPA: AmmeMemoRadiSam system protein B [Kofleriaceae bacterium]|nr:AmmeMemoRadiSam system protein B [Kofleriaceae bacterium]